MKNNDFEKNICGKRLPVESVPYNIGKVFPAQNLLQSEVQTLNQPNTELSEHPKHRTCLTF